MVAPAAPDVKQARRRSGPKPPMGRCAPISARDYAALSPDLRAAWRISEGDTHLWELPSPDRPRTVLLHSAWSGEWHTYTLGVLGDGRVCCDCPGYSHHAGCAHVAMVQRIGGIDKARHLAVAAAARQRIAADAERLVAAAVAPAETPEERRARLDRDRKMDFPE